MGFYHDMADMVKDLLTPDNEGGLGQGTITLTRITRTENQDKPWELSQEISETETLDGAVRGVSKELIGKEMGGTVLLTSDRQAICTVPGMGYSAGDILSVDGVPVNIITVENIPAAGTTVTVKFTIRG